MTTQRKIPASRIAAICGTVLCMLLALAGCKEKVCDHCGEPLEKNAIERAGKTYCDHNCYMQDLFFD